MQVAIPRIGLVAPDQTAVLRHQGLGLAHAAHFELHLGEPPGQLDVVPAGQEQAGPPALDGVVRPTLVEVDLTLDQLDSQVVLLGLGNRGEVPAGIAVSPFWAASCAAMSRASRLSGASGTRFSTSASASSWRLRRLKKPPQGQVDLGPLRGCFQVERQADGRGPPGPFRCCSASPGRAGPAVRPPQRRRARVFRRPRTRRRRRQARCRPLPRPIAPRRTRQQAMGRSAVVAPSDQVAGVGTAVFPIPRTIRFNSTRRRRTSWRWGSRPSTFL